MYVQSSLYVRIQEARHALRPMPWNQGFAKDMAYRVLGYFNREVHGPPEVLLCSEHNRQCFVPLCHLRAVAYAPHAEHYLPLSRLEVDDSLSLEELMLWGQQFSLTRPQALAHV